MFETIGLHIYSPSGYTFCSNPVTVRFDRVLVGTVALLSRYSWRGAV